MEPGTGTGVGDKVGRMSSVTTLLSQYGRLFLLPGLVVGLLFSACTHMGPTPVAPFPPFPVSEQAGFFSVSGLPIDKVSIEDVAEVLDQHAPRVCSALAHDCQFSVIVELFPDQESFNTYGMNPAMQGYYAYSGNARIQMVSPRNAIPRVDIPYADRVLIAVHEFVHLVNNQINPDLPVWLNEGVAAYIGHHDLYADVCQYAFPFELMPALHDLQRSYNSVQAADLFSYSVVDYIGNEFGQDTINRLIRSPEAFEEVLGMTRTEFEARWRKYVSEHYSQLDE